MIVKGHAPYWMFAGLFVLLLFMSGYDDQKDAKLDDQQNTKLDDQQNTKLDDALWSGRCNLDEVRGLMEKGHTISKERVWLDYILRSILQCDAEFVEYVTQRAPAEDLAKATSLVIIKTTAMEVKENDRPFWDGNNIVFAVGNPTDSPDLFLGAKNRNMLLMMEKMNSELCKEGHEENCKGSAHLNDEVKKMMAMAEAKRIARDNKAMEEQNQEIRQAEEAEAAAARFVLSKDVLKYTACMCVEAEKQWKQEIAYQKQIEKEAGVSNKLILYKAGKNIVKIKEALKEIKEMYRKQHKKSLGLNGCQKHIEKMQGEWPEDVYSKFHYCESP